jgi:hypothetical protein
MTVPEGYSSWGALPGGGSGREGGEKLTGVAPGGREWVPYNAGIPYERIAEEDLSLLARENKEAEAEGREYVFATWGQRPAPLWPVQSATVDC